MGGTGVTFIGPATWSGGTITGAGTTIFDNTLAISGDNSKAISGTRIITLNGTTTWGGNTGNLGTGLTVHGSGQEPIRKLISLHFGFPCYKRKEGDKPVTGREDVRCADRRSSQYYLVA
jgi:hypothetical protein